MKNSSTQKVLWTIAALVVLIILAVVFWPHPNGGQNGTTAGNTNAASSTDNGSMGIPAGQALVAAASFSCSGGKTITAAFYEGSSTISTDPSQPPTPAGTVMLTLSDGRMLMLPQTISADGARYASADGSIVFWNKGNTAFITESSTETYSNCATNPSEENSQ